MVHFTQFRPAGLFYSAAAVICLRIPDYSIRTSGGLWICASLPGFSQLITSFFAFQLQGIRHRPIFRLTILLFPLFLLLSASARCFFSFIQALRTSTRTFRTKAFLFLHQYTFPCLFSVCTDYRLYVYCFMFPSLFIFQRSLQEKSFFNTTFLYLWRIGGMNPWHSACKADALANWANSP